MFIYWKRQASYLVLCLGGMLFFLNACWGSWFLAPHSCLSEMGAYEERVDCVENISNKVIHRHEFLRCCIIDLRSINRALFKYIF